MMSKIRVELPYHLRNLAGINSEVVVDVDGVEPLTLGAVLDALEIKYPVLKGTIRDHGTLNRRPFLRFHACGRDFSNDPPDTPLPDEVAQGTEPLLVVGAIAGG